MAKFSRFISVVLWLLLVVSSVYLTYGSVAVARLTSGDADEISPDRLSRGGRAPYSSTAGLFSCASFIIEPQLDARLKQLDLHFGREELSRSQVRLATTLEFLKTYLRCKPADANAWTRSALISNTMMSDSDATAAYLSLSIYYAPYQSDLERTRNSVINGLSPRLKEEYKDLLFQRPATSIDNGAVD